VVNPPFPIKKALQVILKWFRPYTDDLLIL
jgi:hypothetical protein